MNRFIGLTLQIPFRPSLRSGVDSTALLMLLHSRHSVRHLSVALLGVAALLLVSPASQAEIASSVPISIDWRAPSTCPTAHEILANVLALHQGTTLSEHQANAVVTVSHDASSLWSASIVVQAPYGTATRQLQGETCAALADASALVLSFTLRNATPPAPAVAAPPAPVAPSPLHLSVAALGLVDFGTLPSASGGAALSLGLLFEPWRVEAQASWLSPKSGYVSSREWEGADFSYASLSLRSCRLFALGSSQFGPCAGVGVGRLTASGFGSDLPSENSHYLGSLQGSMLGLLRLSPFLRLRYGLDFIIPLNRANFFVESAGSVHQSPALSVQGLAGPELTF